MGRSPSCDESGLKKGPWTPEEDDKLIQHIQKHGHGSWRALPKLAGLNRCGKSCRLRWTNYLRPDIKRGKFSQEEEQTILNLHAILGNKWSAIATHLPGRTDNEIKNFWNTHLKKKLIQMGFDPMTHRPRTDLFSTLPQLLALANLIENPNSWQDQAMRIQTEAIQMARLNQYMQILLNNNATTPNIPTNYQNNTVSNLPDMSAYNLLKSDSANSVLLNNLESAPPSSLFLQDLVTFSDNNLPDLLQPCSGGGKMVRQGNMDNSPSWNIPASMTPSPGSVPVAAPVTETSITNTGDACSTSSYGGAQLWSELLDDPIFHEIA